jgi:hypothetical protein
MLFIYGFIQNYTIKDAGMSYCTVADLRGAYGEDRISPWSRIDPGRADKAVYDAGAEIDGYLLSGWYAVPLAGTPSTIRKYCVDIACANLIISAEAVDSDPGGDAVIEQTIIVRSAVEETRAIMARQLPLTALITNPGRFDDRTDGTARYANTETNTLVQRHVRGSRILPILVRYGQKGRKRRTRCSVGYFRQSPANGSTTVLKA